MHEQLGTIFDGGGRPEEEASILTPVAIPAIFYRWWFLSWGRMQLGMRR